MGKSNKKDVEAECLGKFAYLIYCRNMFGNEKVYLEWEELLPLSRESWIESADAVQERAFIRREVKSKNPIAAEDVYNTYCTGARLSPCPQPSWQDLAPVFKNGWRFLAGFIDDRGCSEKVEPGSWQHFKQTYRENKMLLLTLASFYIGLQLFSILLHSLVTP